MKTMTVKLTRPVTVDVIEFELPHFSKKGNAYYCVINPMEAIHVGYYPTIDAPFINVMRSPENIEEAFNWEAENLSREEFIEVYNKAISSLTAKFLSI